MDITQNTTNEIITKDQFWNSISILRKNFHVINRKLSGSKIISCFTIKNKYSISPMLKLQTYINDQELIKYFGIFGMEIEQTSCDDSAEGIILHLLKVFPKLAVNTTWYHLHIIDKIDNKFYNIPLLSIRNTRNFAFLIELRAEKLLISPCDDREENVELDVVQRILSNYIKPKLVKWALTTKFHDINIKSHSLIDIELYNQLYCSMKAKYSAKLIKIWPESTDPLKFIYEDIAIAAYLITLWNQHQSNSQQQNFVDLGCGNGLLVHILVSEGYSGYGIDVRKRKIWNYYESRTKLVEETIIPNNFTAFKDTEWIIGNHSDELSSWIPIISAMSSYESKFFLLPCCAYELSGNKFQRRNCNLSVYNDFIDYVIDLSKICGFVTLRDRLKIPSTKRHAIIGLCRSYEKYDYIEKKKTIENFLKMEINLNETYIKTRSTNQPVLNCTKVDVNIIDGIVKIIFNKILENDIQEKNVNLEWRTGKSILLEDIAKIIPKDYMIAIKSQCGGLKTLLKNKHEIFLVTGDKVKLRKPQINTKNLEKKRKCFFNLYHPDGCLLEKEFCRFIH